MRTIKSEESECSLNSTGKTLAWKFWIRVLVLTVCGTDWVTLLFPVFDFSISIRTMRFVVLAPFLRPLHVLIQPVLLLALTFLQPSAVIPELNTTMHYLLR